MCLYYFLQKNYPNQLLLVQGLSYGRRVDVLSLSGKCSTFRMFICDPSHKNRPVVGKAHLHNNNERSWEKIMKIKINFDQQSCVKSLYYVGFPQRRYWFKANKWLFTIDIKSQYLFLASTVLFWCDMGHKFHKIAQDWKWISWMASDGKGYVGPTCKNRQKNSLKPQYRVSHDYQNKREN